MQYSAVQYSKSTVKYSTISTYLYSGCKLICQRMKFKYIKVRKSQLNLLVKYFNFIQGVPINILERKDLNVVFDFWYLMPWKRKYKKGLYSVQNTSYELFIKCSTFLYPIPAAAGVIENHFFTFLKFLIVHKLRVNVKNGIYLEFVQSLSKDFSMLWLQAHWALT